MTNDILNVIRDPERLAALRRLGLLDSAAEESFDRVTRLATMLLDAPVSLVSLVDADRQFFKSAVGLAEPWASRRETPLSHSFCQHVVASGEPLIVEDAREHPLLRDNLAIPDLDVVAYAGFPLVAPATRLCLGAFCVIDTRPRSWSERDLNSIRDLAAMVATELELRGRLIELHESEARAALANAAKTHFVSRMSHELRTPMNSILGFAQLLEMDQRLTMQQRESLEFIIKGGQHLLGLINEALDIAQIETGHINLAVAPIVVGAAVDEALALVEFLAAQRGIQIARAENGYGERRVLADPQRLRQVLLNLLANAIKYHREGGQVSIECALAGPLRLRLTVRDDGPGIAPEKLGRLFQPFDRLGAEHTPVEGAGLGLALSKRLVEAMGGSMGAESRMGLGSAFWLELPLAETSLDQIEQFGEELADAVRGVGRKYVILYIEDNAMNFEVVRMALEGIEQAELLRATHGRQGVALARQRHPDLILLDLNLPDIMGDEVLRQLRNDAATRDTPVLIISAETNPTQIEQLLAAGARAYLTKPLNIRRFLAEVGEAVKR